MLHLLTSILSVLIDCPGSLPPMAVKRTTNDGQTHTTGRHDEITRDCIVDYWDNRTAIESRFHSYGAITLGHRVLFQDRDLSYQMRVAIPEGRYTLVDYGSDLHSNPYTICVMDEEVVLSIDISTQGPSYRSFVWNFEVIIGSPADLNGDGLVDGQALSLLLNQWGQPGESEDLNHDGTVDGQDLLVLLSEWT